MFPLQACEQLEGFHLYSIFSSLSITLWCPVNMNILAPKIGAFHIGPKKIDGGFLEKVLMILIIFEQFMETIFLNKST
jgi:hypothetical protein